MLAWQLTMSLERTADLLPLARRPQLRLLVRLGAFTPSIVWLSQRFRFERQGLMRALAVHLPAVVLFSLAAHRRDAGGAVVAGHLGRRRLLVVAGGPARGPA